MLYSRKLTKRDGTGRMMKTIEVLGIKMNINYTREQLQQVEKFFHHPNLQTVELVTAEMLLQTIENPFMGDVLGRANLVVMGDTVVLDTSGLESVGRRREIQEGRFIQCLMKQMEQSRRTVFVLGNRAEEIRFNVEYLKKNYPRLQILDVLSLENDVVEAEDVVNAINSVIPDLVLSLLPSPLQEEFLEEHYKKINARVWLGAGQSLALLQQKGFGVWLRQKLCKNRLKKLMDQYKIME